MKETSKSTNPWNSPSNYPYSDCGNVYDLMHYAKSAFLWERKKRKWKLFPPSLVDYFSGKFSRIPLNDGSTVYSRFNSLPRLTYLKLRLRLFCILHVIFIHQLTHIHTTDAMWISSQPLGARYSACITLLHMSPLIIHQCEVRIFLGTREHLTLINFQLGKVLWFNSVFYGDAK